MAQTSTSRSALIRQQLAKYPTLDPKAVLAVAAQEGLGGGIGDNGTSFGPFQLHYGGAYPSSAPQGAAASQRWAWSPQGIDYALSRIASVAGGMKGAPAVSNIVSRFERPADPRSEIAGALGAYGLPAPQAGPAATAAPPSLARAAVAAPAVSTVPATPVPSLAHVLGEIGSRTPDYTAIWRQIGQQIRNR